MVYASDRTAWARAHNARDGFKPTGNGSTVGFTKAPA
jgi:hypothetical protein